MAGAYATFAARGRYCPPRAVTTITDASGAELALPAQACKQVLEQPVADTVNSVLRGVVTGGTDRQHDAQRLDRPAGRRQDRHDQRVAGPPGSSATRPQLATAVWVGDPGAPGRQVKSMQDVRINGQFYGHVYGGGGAGVDLPRHDALGPRGRRGGRLRAPGADDARARTSACRPSPGSAARRGRARAHPRPACRSATAGGSRARGTRRGTAAYTVPRAGRRVDFGGTRHAVRGLAPLTARPLERVSPLSAARTAAATRPPSARPATCGPTAFMTAPMPRGPLGAGRGDGLGDQRRELLVGQLRRQVGRQDLLLGELAGGAVLGAAAAERLRRLAPLLGLAGDDLELLVGRQRAGRLARRPPRCRSR